MLGLRYKSVDFGAKKSQKEVKPTSAYRFLVSRMWNVGSAVQICRLWGEKEPGLAELVGPYKLRQSYVRLDFSASRFASLSVCLCLSVCLSLSLSHTHIYSLSVPLFHTHTHTHTLATTNPATFGAHLGLTFGAGCLFFRLALRVRGRRACLRLSSDTDQGLGLSPRSTGSRIEALRLWVVGYGRSVVPVHVQGR